MRVRKSRDTPEPVPEAEASPTPLPGPAFASPVVITVRGVRAELAWMLEQGCGGNAVVYRLPPEIPADVTAEVRSRCLAVPGTRDARSARFFTFASPADRVLRDILAALP